MYTLYPEKINSRSQFEYRVVTSNNINIVIFKELSQNVNAFDLRIFFTKLIKHLQFDPNDKVYFVECDLGDYEPEFSHLYPDDYYLVECDSDCFVHYYYYLSDNEESTVKQLLENTDLYKPF